MASSPSYSHRTTPIIISPVESQATFTFDDSQQQGHKTSIAGVDADQKAPVGQDSTAPPTAQAQPPCLHPTSYPEHHLRTGLKINHPPTQLPVIDSGGLKSSNLAAQTTIPYPTGPSPASYHPPHPASQTRMDLHMTSTSPEHGCLVYTEGKHDRRVDGADEQDVDGDDEMSEPTFYTALSTHARHEDLQCRSPPFHTSYHTTPRSHRKSKVNITSMSMSIDQQRHSSSYQRTAGAVPEGSSASSLVGPTAAPKDREHAFSSPLPGPDSFNHPLRSRGPSYNAGRYDEPVSSMSQGFVDGMDGYLPRAKLLPAASQHGVFSPLSEYGSQSPVSPSSVCPTDTQFEVAQYDEDWQARTSPSESHDHSIFWSAKDESEIDKFNKRGKKVEMACHFCRVRKLKCNGMQPICQHCSKRQQTCTWDVAVRRRGPGAKKKEQLARGGVDLKQRASPGWRSAAHGSGEMGRQVSHSTFSPGQSSSLTGGLVSREGRFQVHPDAAMNQHSPISHYADRQSLARDSGDVDQSLRAELGSISPQYNSGTPSPKTHDTFPLQHHQSVGSGISYRRQSTPARIDPFVPRSSSSSLAGALGSRAEYSPYGRDYWSRRSLQASPASPMSEYRGAQTDYSPRSAGYDGLPPLPHHPHVTRHSATPQMPVHTSGMNPIFHHAEQRSSAIYSTAGGPLPAVRVSSRVPDDASHCVTNTHSRSWNGLGISGAITDPRDNDDLARRSDRHLNRGEPNTAVASGFHPSTTAASRQDIRRLASDSRLDNAMAESLIDLAHGPTPPTAIAADYHKMPDSQTPVKRPDLGAVHHPHSGEYIASGPHASNVGGIPVRASAWCPEYQTSSSRMWAGGPENDDGDAGPSMASGRANYRHATTIRPEGVASVGVASAAARVRYQT